MSETVPTATDGLSGRGDFQATSDPALLEAPDRGAKLLSYRELYALWERQHWAVQDLDFTQDEKWVSDSVLRVDEAETSGSSNGASRSAASAMVTRVPSSFAGEETTCEGTGQGRTRISAGAERGRAQILGGAARIGAPADPVRTGIVTPG